MIQRLTEGVRARLAAHARVHFARRIVHVHCDPPVASFTFDDVPLSAYRTGASLLEACDVRGTYYVAGSRIGRVERDEPMMGAGEIRDLAARGHEIGCHSYEHERAGGRKLEEIDADLARNARMLSEILPGTQLESFAYPFGEVTVGLKRVAGARFGACRTIRAGVNAGRTDAALLRANALYGRPLELGHLERVLAAALGRAGWVIFYTHDVRESPSPFGCSPAYLDRVLARTREAGIDVVPVGEVLRRVTAV